MVNPGDVIANRDSGSLIEFLETAASSGGQRLRYRHLIHTRGPFVERHFHPNQDETITVEAGALVVEVEGTSHRLTPGQTLTTIGSISWVWRQHNLPSQTHAAAHGSRCRGHGDNQEPLDARASRVSVSSHTSASRSLIVK